MELQYYCKNSGLNQHTGIRTSVKLYTSLWGNFGVPVFKSELYFLLQVNLEYLARVVFNADKLLFPDSLVGTDSHTTMINGLGVIGWGVGG